MKKGFTLLQLLVVIIILAIVALIATPIVLDVVNGLRKNDIITSNVSIEYGDTYQYELDLKDNYNIKWESNNPDLVSVDSNGVISINKNEDGEAVVKAISEEQKILANIIVKVSKIETVIDVSDIKIEENEISLKYGETKQLNAIISPSNATNKNVIWTSNNSLVSVDSNGKISINKNEDGEAIITVKTVDGNYTDNVLVKVKSVPTKVSGIKIEENEISLKYGETKQINAIISPLNATNKNVIWTSNNSLVSVDSNGKITINKNEDGEAIITVKTVDGNYTDSIRVKVKSVDNTIKVSDINIEENEISLKYGETKQLNAIISPSNATNKTVIWTSNNSLVNVDSNGKISINKNEDGEAIITVKTVDGNYIDTVLVKVKSIPTKVSGIKIEENEISLKYGETKQLNAIISPSNATNKTVIWTSNNLSVATISANGIVTAVGKGNAIITVTTEDGNYKSSCTVTVERNEYTVKFNTNGGDSVAEQNVLEGEKVIKPSEPQKQGYIFNGWLLNNSKYNFNNKVTSNITLTASWRIDFNAVDYCSSMPITYEKDGVKFKRCIKDFVISTDSVKRQIFMQNFSITSKYIYFSAPLNGSWMGMGNYSESDLYNEQIYNSFVDSADFETISSVFVSRIDKNSGNSKIMELKYSGHGQGFDTISGDTDMLYLTSIASPVHNYGRIIAGSGGLTYAPFKENGGVLVPDVTFAFKAKSGAVDVISRAAFMRNGVFDSTSYYNEIKLYSKNSLMAKNIFSMAIDEKNDRLAFSIGKYVYIYSLSQVKNGTAQGYLKQIAAYSNQGLELDGENLYVATNESIHKFNISTGKEVKSIKIDLEDLYKNRVQKGSVIETEGLSIYNGKLYVGVTSKENRIGYNDIYLIENFE